MFKDVSEFIFEVKKLGYTDVVKKTSKQIVISVDASIPRVDALNDIAKKLKGKYNERAPGSSIGRSEFAGGFTAIVKTKGGGGSGAGSDITKLVESAQCIYAAAAAQGVKSFIVPSLKKHEKDVDIDEKFTNIYTKLPDDWIASSVLGGKILAQKHKKKYTYHRGSKWVQSLENHWKHLNSASKTFSNLNKWSPADIWMISKAGEKIDVTKTNSIAELNELLITALKSNDIIGVSLKKMKGTARYSLINVSSSRPTWKFLSTTTGLKDFWNSADGYIMFEGGKIQFRRFGSTWQGEIKGKNANMGKISGGPIIAALDLLKIKMIKQNELVRPTEKNLKSFYEWYSGISYHDKISFAEFKRKAAEKDHNWYVSKIMTTQLMYHVEKASRDKKQKITSSFLNYASSQSLISGPFAKIY